MADEHAGQRLSCRDLLAIPSLAGTVVLGGERGLEREVSRVNVMEVPDVIDWVRPGEFLMTTGYPFRHEPEALIGLVPQLAERGVVALGIKTRRFIDRVPAEAIAAADRCGLTLFELPPATAFSDVVRDVMGHVLVRESSSLSVLQSRIQTLTGLLLEGRGIGAFLSALEGMVGNPVVLVDSSGAPLLTPESAALFANDAGGFAWGDLPDRVPAGGGSVVLALGSRKTQAYVSEVPVYRRLSALLLIVEWSGECRPVDRLTIDQVSALAGLELKNANARRAVEEKYVDQFIQDWLTGRIPALPDLKLRADACGVRLEEPAAGARYRAVLVRIAAGARGKTSRRHTPAALANAAAQHGCDALFARLGDDDAAIVRYRGEAGAGTAAEADAAERRLLQRLHAAVRDGMRGETSTLYVGCAVVSPERLHESYADAVRIRRICDISGPPDDVVTADRLGVYTLLHPLAGTPEARSYHDRWIQPLAEYDRKHESTSLVATLEAYFQAKGNIRATADKLFTHYNTVVYRLERIGAMLRIDIEDAEAQLQLQLALKLHRMRANEAEA